MERKQVPDNQLNRLVTQKLSQRSAGSGARVSATVANGYVTISGTVEHEYERRPLVNAISSLSGVRRVVDQITLAPKKKRE
jgi:osmotically-inducible protein OsmY